MLLNYKNENKDLSPVKIRAGENYVIQEKSTKLLGVTIEESQSWREHFYGKNGLFSSLNKRPFAIRRVANQIPRNQLIQLAYALWMSKLKYGLQLCTNVRTEESEKKTGNMKSAQIAQNKLMRLLINVSYRDRTSTSDLLNETGLLSVNQLAANIKLCEVWKSEKIVNYPVHLQPNNSALTYSERSVRPTTSRKWNQDAKSSALKDFY